MYTLNKTFACLSVLISLSVRQKVKKVKSKSMSLIIYKSYDI